jgi:antirestriction protein
MYKNDLDLTADIIDIRDIIAAIEEIEEDTAGIRSGSVLNPEQFLKAYREFHSPSLGYSDSILEKLAMLTNVLSDLRGMGGDEQWRGEWYPVTLIRDSYFQTYAQELAEDIGAIKADSTWPHTCIDWEHAARELRYDYSAVEINGATYWTR